MPFSPFELLIVLFIVLLLFGAKRVPEMSRSLGSSLREFKDGIATFGGDDEPKPTPKPKPRELERGAVDSPHAERTTPPSERTT